MHHGVSRCLRATLSPCHSLRPSDPPGRLCPSDPPGRLTRAPVSPPENAAGHARVHAVPQPGGETQTAAASAARGGHHPGQVRGLQQVRPTAGLPHAPGRSGRGLVRAGACLFSEAPGLGRMRPGPAPSPPCRSPSSSNDGLVLRQLIGAGVQDCQVSFPFRAWVTQGRVQWDISI